MRGRCDSENRPGKEIGARIVIMIQRQHAKGVGGAREGIGAVRSASTRAYLSTRGHEFSQAQRFGKSLSQTIGGQIFMFCQKLKDSNVV